MNCKSRKRGVAILIVLALLSITLTASYAMMRAQHTSSQIQLNYERRSDARLAAYTGISIALQEMQESDWAGVDSTLTRDLGDGQSFTVTYATGDPSLSPEDPQYAEYPYRVTITSTGKVVDPATSLETSTHTIRSVVQLVRRKVNDPPAGWSSMQNYTVYHWGTESNKTLNLDLPVRIEGPIYAQNEIKLGANYPGDGDDAPFAGEIDEVVVFAEPLSGDRIADLHHGVTSLHWLVNTSSLDAVARWRFDESSNSLIARDSVGDYDGLYEGANSGASASSPYGGSGSATFNGHSDQVHIARIPSTGKELTVLAWIKPSAFNPSGGRIISKIRTSDFDSYWMLGTSPSGSNHRLQFSVQTKSNEIETLVASSGNLATGTWTFVAAVYNGSSLRLYKDGVLVGSKWVNGSTPSNRSLAASIGNNPPGSPRARLLRDLNRLRSWGVDYRPLTGPIHAPVNESTAKTRAMATDELQVTWNVVPASNTRPISHPGAVQSYRLYPGGKSYSVGTLGGTLRNVTLGPDPLTNPLGVFLRNGNLDVQENVQVNGVLIVDGESLDPDVEIYGTNVIFNPTALPSISGISQAIQLPTAIVRDDFRIYSSASGTVSGVIASWDECGFKSGPQRSAFTIKGKLFTNQFFSEPRTEWNQSHNWWKNRSTSFLDNLVNNTPVAYFPVWLLLYYGLDPEPRLIVKPDPADPVYHWPAWNQPIFVAHPEDGGLRWNVLDVSERS